MPNDINGWARAEADAWASRNVERVLSVYAADCLYEDLPAGKRSQGTAAIRAYLEEAFASIPDLTIELTSWFGDGKRLCCEGLLKGTFSGQIAGLPPPNGKTFSVRYAHVCELQDGKATRVTDYYDMVSLLRQLELP